MLRDVDSGDCQTVRADYLVAADGVHSPIRNRLGIATFAPQYCRELLTKAIGEQIELEIIEVAAWQPHEQVADELQCGRVFLVGDSAHTMPPFKAGVGEISRVNGWEFHIDGIHLNTKGGRILVEAV